MGTKIIKTKRFLKELKKLPQHIQCAVQKTVDLIKRDPAYRSLHTHDFKKEEDQEIFYVNHRVRLIGQREGNKVYLLDVGWHDKKN